MGRSSLALAGLLAALLIGTLVSVAIVGSPPTSPRAGSAGGNGPSAGADLMSAGGSAKHPSGSPESNVTFAASGLPANSSWEILLSRAGSLFEFDNATSGPSLVEHLDNGTYDLAAASSNASFATFGLAPTLDVRGSNTTVPVPFYLGYDVTFSEQGLPFNVTWNVSVTADGVTENRTFAGATGELWVPAGEFSYTDGSDGYLSALGAGEETLTQNGTVPVDFVKPRPVLGVLRLTLDVPAADVYLNGIAYPSVPQGTTEFNLTPGIWTIFVHAPGYGDYFNVTKIGSNATVSIAVILNPNPSNPGPGLLSAGAEVIVVGLVLGVAVLGLLLVFAWGRLSRR